jgi:hypothetical protein
MTINIRPLRIMTISIIMTISFITLSIKRPGITSRSIKILRIRPLIILTISIMTLFMKILRLSSECL